MPSSKPELGPPERPRGAGRQDEGVLEDLEGQSVPEAEEARASGVPTESEAAPSASAVPANAGASAGAKDVEAATERDPLLADEERWASYSGGTADETRLLQQSEWVNANSPWYHVARGAGSAVLYLVTVSGAYFFVLAFHPTLSPRCYEYPPLHEALCNFSTVSLWTFPLVCLFAAAVLFTKNILDSRLYYECLLNTILLDYSGATLNNPLVWLLFLWGACTFICHFYVRPGWSPGNVVHFVFSMFAYYAPIASFLCLFCINWKVESQLIPLAKFTETDPHYSVEVLAAAAENYAPEAHFRVAFENLNDSLKTEESETLDRGGQVNKLKSKKFFRLLADELHTEVTHACESWKAEAEATSAQEGPVGRAVAAAAAGAGLAGRPEMARYLGDPSRPEVLTVQHSVCRGYWVYRILFHGRLDDQRSRSFRNWFYGYLVFCALLLLLLAYLLVCTAATCLVFEEVVPVNHWAVRRFQLPSYRPHHLGDYS